MQPHAMSSLMGVANLSITQGYIFLQVCNWGWTILRTRVSVALYTGPLRGEEKRAWYISTVRACTKLSLKTSRVVEGARTNDSVDYT